MEILKLLEMILADSFKRSRMVSAFTITCRIEFNVSWSVMSLRIITMLMADLLCSSYMGEVEMDNIFFRPFLLMIRIV